MSQNTINAYKRFIRKEKNPNKKWALKFEVKQMQRGGKMGFKQNLLNKLQARKQNQERNLAVSRQKEIEKEGKELVTAQKDLKFTESKAAISRRRDAFQRRKNLALKDINRAGDIKRAAFKKKLVSLAKSASSGKKFIGTLTGTRTRSRPRARPRARAASMRKRITAIKRVRASRRRKTTTRRSRPTRRRKKRSSGFDFLRI